MTFIIAPWLLVIVGILLAIAVAWALFVVYRVLRAMFKNWRASPGEVDMSLGEIMDFLNYGIALERQQTELYRLAGKSVLDQGGDGHLAAALERFSEVEAEHEQKLRAKIEELGGGPTIISPPAGWAAGAVMGAATSVAATANLLQSVVWIEQKAIDHYLRVINGIQDTDLQRFFMKILVDEEGHAAWAQERVEQITTPREQDTF